MKSDRETQISYDIAFMLNLKKSVQINLFTKNEIVTDIENKLVVIWGGRLGKGKDKLED